MSARRVKTANILFDDCVCLNIWRDLLKPSAGEEDERRRAHRRRGHVSFERKDNLFPHLEPLWSLLHLLLRTSLPRRSGCLTRTARWRVFALQRWL